MEIKVKFEIGLAKGLEEILMALPELLKLAQGEQTAAIVPLRGDEQPVVEPGTPVADADAPVADETPAGPKEYTEEDVRAAMERARVRIEGPDWAEKKSECYKRYHKALTQEFKNISALLGAEKPSMLAPDKRESFILMADDLWGEDGAIKASKDLPY